MTESQNYEIYGVWLYKKTVRLIEERRVDMFIED